MRKGRVWLVVKMSPAALALSGLGACFIPVPTGPLDYGSTEPDLTIVYDLQPQANEDYVTVYGGPDHEAFATLIAGSLPIENPQFATTFVVFDAIEGTLVSDATPRRMATRRAEALTLEINTKPLQEAAASQQVDRIRLTVCYPTVETRFTAAAARAETLDCNLLGTSWNISVDNSPFTILVSLHPRESAWRLFVGILSGWFALWSLIAFFIGRVVRRDVPRAGGLLVVATTLISLFGALAAFGGATMIGTLAGPADNLALVRDLDGSQWVYAATLPAMGAVVPILVLLLTLTLGRPWRRGRDRRTAQASTSFSPPPVPPG